MTTKSDVRTLIVNRLFSVMIGLGIIISLLGFAFDLLPGSSPGVSFPQVTLIFAGILFALAGLILRKPTNRRKFTRNLLKNSLVSIITVVVIVVILEIGLAMANVKTRYPAYIPDSFLDPVPWWTCDELGCHYDYEQMQIACDNKEVSGRRCIVNSHGFHDTDEFINSGDSADKLRVLMLGDSFTFGGTAELGQSFVETIETHLPNAVVWNTGIPGAGTNQAILSLQTLAPILKPQVVILGFYMNDFEDNMFPIDSYFMGSDANKYPFAIRQYLLDDIGNVTKLANQAELYFRFNLVEPPSNEIERLIGITRVGSLLLNTLDTIQNMVQKADGRRVNAQVRVTRQYLTELRDYTLHNEIELLVLVIPRREDLSSIGTLYDNAIGLLDELNILYLDPIDMLNTDNDYAPEPDIHWSTQGHQKIGFVLAECLEQIVADGSPTDCERLAGYAD